MKATFVFPHQLFDFSPAISRDKKIFIISDPLFFKDKKYPVSFHKSKILLHLLSINSYNKELLENHGILLIVKSCNIEYKKPAQLEDLLEILLYFPLYFPNQALFLL